MSNEDINSRIQQRLKQRRDDLYEFVRGYDRGTYEDIAIFASTLSSDLPLREKARVEHYCMSLVRRIVTRYELRYGIFLRGSTAGLAPETVVPADVRRFIEECQIDPKSRVGRVYAWVRETFFPPICCQCGRDRNAHLAPGGECPGHFPDGE